MFVLNKSRNGYKKGSDQHIPGQNHASFTSFSLLEKSPFGELEEAHNANSAQI
jgi:hypothetical protein